MYGLIILIVPLPYLGLALPMGTAAAQEKQRVSYKIPAENAKFTQQLLIDVGNTPGHQVRVAELRWTFPSIEPLFSGVKLIEPWIRFTSDYTDGRQWDQHWLFGVCLESGDKSFAREATVSQSAGSGGLTTATVVASIAGGTLQSNR